MITKRQRRPTPDVRNKIMDDYRDELKVPPRPSGRKIRKGRKKNSSSYVITRLTPEEVEDGLVQVAERTAASTKKPAPTPCPRNPSSLVSPLSPPRRPPPSASSSVAADAVSTDPTPVHRNYSAPSGRSSMSQESFYSSSSSSQSLSSSVNVPLPTPELTYGKTIHASNTIEAVTERSPTKGLLTKQTIEASILCSRTVPVPYMDDNTIPGRGQAVTRKGTVDEAKSSRGETTGSPPTTAQPRVFSCAETSSNCYGRRVL